MLTVQQAVFTVESLIGKVQQQNSSFINSFKKMNICVTKTNSYAKKMNN
ncbi:hypothetical protein JCM14450A_03140 [Geobacillus stearothermophilus]